MIVCGCHTYRLTHKVPDLFSRASVLKQGSPDHCDSCTKRLSHGYPPTGYHLLCVTHFILVHKHRIQQMRTLRFVPQQIDIRHCMPTTFKRLRAAESRSCRQMVGYLSLQLPSAINTCTGLHTKFLTTASRTINTELARRQSLRSCPAYEYVRWFDLG